LAKTSPHDQQTPDALGMLRKAEIEKLVADDEGGWRQARVMAAGGMDERRQAQLLWLGI
jgi:hypothetical protein